MQITNRTKLGYDLAMKFSVSNLMYTRKFNMVIFPFLAFCTAIILMTNKEISTVYSLIVILVGFMLPAFLYLLSYGMSAMSAKHNVDIVNKTVIEYTFSDKGFTVKKNDNEPSPMITYNYIKSLVEFKTIFIMYFKGAAPIVIDKENYWSDDISTFKNFMQTKIDEKKCVFKK